MEFLPVQSVIHPFFANPSLFDSDNDNNNDRELWGPDSHASLVRAGGGCLGPGVWAPGAQGVGGGDSGVRTLLFSPHRHPSPLLLLVLFG